MASARKITIEFLGKDKTLGKTADGIAGHTSKLGGVLASVGKKAALGFAAATAAGGAFLIKVGAPYVDSLNKIKVLSGATDTQMQRVAKTLEGQSAAFAKMGFTTGDAAAGVVELVKAGMSLQDSMKAVAGTMTLAKAGELSVADASTLVSNTLNTFGLKARDAGKVANYLANAANISSADVTDLAEAFKYVAPVAASSGVKVQQVNAMLAELSNKGIQASSAGTGLRNMFLSLQSPAGAGGKAIKSLGVDVFTASGKARPFRDVLGDLAKALKGVDDQTRKADLKAIFGKTGINSAQVLLQGGVKGLDQYTKGVTKAGAAQKLAESASKGLMGTLNTLKATFISLGQSLYRQLSPIVDKALQPLVKALSGLPKMIGPVSKAFAGMFSHLGGGKGASQFAKTFTAIKKAVADLMPTLKKIGGDIMGALGPGLKQIGQVITTQFLPAFRNILPVLTVVGKVLLTIFGGAVVGVIKGAVKVITGLVQVISGVFNLVSDLIHGRWGKLWGDFKQIIGGALKAIIGAIQVWWNAGILAIFKRGILFLTKGIWEKGWTALKGVVPKAMNAIKGAAQKGLAALGRMIVAGVKGYFRIWKSGFSLIWDVVRTGWKVLRSVFGGAVAALRSMVATFISGIKSRFVAGWNAIKSTAVAAFARLKSAVSSGVAKVISFVRSLPGKIKSALGNLGHLLWDAGTAIIQGLINGITSKITDLKNKLSEITHLIPIHKGPIDKDRKLLTPAGVAIMEGLIHGIQSRKVKLTKVLSAVTGYISKQNDKIKDLLSKRNDIVSGFKGMTSSVFSADLSNPDTGAPPTVQALIAYQRQQAQRAAQISGDMKRLAKMGLSKALIKQLASSGDAGIAQMHALANGSASDVRTLNALDAQTTKSLRAAGLTAGNKIYGSDLARTRKDKATAEAIARVLRHELDRQRKNTVVEVTLDGRVIHTSLLRVKRKQGGKKLGLD